MLLYKIIGVDYLYLHLVSVAFCCGLTRDMAARIVFFDKNSQPVSSIFQYHCMFIINKCTYNNEHIYLNDFFLG